MRKAASAILPPRIRGYPGDDRPVVKRPPNPDCLAHFVQSRLDPMKLTSVLWPRILLLGWLLPALAADKPVKVKEVPKDVEVFKAPDFPDRTFSEVEVYTDDITLPEEHEITRKYAKKAKSKKADALLVMSLVPSGEQLVPFQGFKRTYAYKAVAVRFTGPPGSAPRVVDAPSSENRKRSSSDIQLEASGTGFFITKDGYMISNHHVVSNAVMVRVLMKGELLETKVVKTDPANDLALLKVRVPSDVTPLPIGSSRAVRLGDPVITVGFPRPGIQGQEPKLTKGNISSLSGVRDTPHEFQISNPIQPGNSGGALVDQSGNVVGIVVATLRGGQNVNYAIKSAYLKAMLENASELPDISLAVPFLSPRTDREVIDQTVEASAQVLAFH
jgi:S1-C subfamily serine protease